MDRLRRELKVVADPGELRREAGERFARAAAFAAGERGVFTVALSGGSTPRDLYAGLAKEPLRSRVPWERVRIFFGDERHVPPDHPESNYRMAAETLLSRVPIPPDGVHRIPAEDPDPVAAAQAYERTLREALGLTADQLPRLDLVLLGLGEDGHTASLFPGGSAIRERKRLVAADRQPRIGAWRITLTLPVLNAAARVMFLVTGASKAEALRDVLQPSGDAAPPPAALVQPAEGELVWLVDAAAARGLGNSAA